MIYTDKIEKAINFAIKTHEVYQKQKRKGKDIPYIVHPLTLGIILARANASEDIIIAGILHDTMEDSIQEKKVNFEMIKNRFGSNVANLVLSVTETDKNLSWEDRKLEAYNHIDSFSHDSIFLKSADVLSNVSEIYNDYVKEGDSMFLKFNSGKDKILNNYKKVIISLIDKWPLNPLKNDLNNLLILINKMNK